MAEQQKTFDFNRAQRQKFIRLLPLPKRSHLKHVLERIEWYLGDNPTCWPFARTLAEDCNISLSTVTRALSELRSMGYITIEPHYIAGVGQTYNHYGIVWTKVVNDSQSPAVDEPAAPPTRRLKQRRPLAKLGEGPSPPSQNAPPLRQNAPPLRQIDVGPTSDCHRPSVNLTEGLRQADRPLNHTMNQESKSHGNHGHGKGLGGKKRNGLNWGRQLSLQELKDPASVDRLYHFARRAGWVDNSEDARIRFHRLAIHCVREGNNPPAMFSANIVADRWHGTDSDHDAAARAIQRLDCPAERTVSGRFEMPRELFRMPAAVLPGGE